jgi:hypothetical protein
MFAWLNFYFYEIAALLLGQTIDAIKSFNMFTPQGERGVEGGRYGRGGGGGWRGGKVQIYF